jgi:Protein kinase domain
MNPDGDAADAIARFHREAQAASRISSDATARVLDVGTLGDVPFMVMERLEGCDLESLVDGGDEMPVGTAVDYVLQACEGLAEAHAAGIVHRDVKPSNLFLTRAADGSCRVKLIDFGVSRFAVPLSSRGEVTQTRALIGSPTYMSPEQMRSSRRVDSRSDIWSMGVVLFSLLTRGRSPFEAQTLPEICAHVMDGEPKSPRAIRGAVPRKLERVILRCLEKDPARRYQTAGELAAALAPFGPPGSDARAARIRRIVGGAALPLARRRWSRAGLVAAVAGVLCVGLRTLHALPSFAAPEGDRVACDPPDTTTRDVRQAVAARANTATDDPVPVEAPAIPAIAEETTRASSAELTSGPTALAVAERGTFSTAKIAGRATVAAHPRPAVSLAHAQAKVLALAPDDDVDVPEFGSRE